jgi:hypothetical protein
VERSGELNPFFLSHAGRRIMELSFDCGDTMMQTIKQESVLVREPCMDSKRHRHTFVKVVEFVQTELVPETEPSIHPVP